MNTKFQPAHCFARAFCLSVCSNLFIADKTNGKHGVCLLQYRIFHRFVMFIIVAVQMLLYAENIAVTGNALIKSGSEFRLQMFFRRLQNVFSHYLRTGDIFDAFGAAGIRDLCGALHRNRKFCQIVLYGKFALLFFARTERV